MRATRTWIHTPELTHALRQPKATVDAQSPRCMSWIVEGLDGYVVGIVPTLPVLAVWPVAVTVLLSASPHAEVSQRDRGSAPQPGQASLCCGRPINASTASLACGVPEV